MSRWLLIAMFAVCLGCNRPAVQTVPVQGKITLDGGVWPRPGVLYFTPIEAAPEFPLRPGTANFSADGTFRARTFKEGDGLVPGTYGVNVECWESPPTMDPNAPPAKSYVPARFQSGATNDFQVVVPADASAPVEVRFDVTSQ